MSDQVLPFPSRRASSLRFALWLLPWTLVLIVGLAATGDCLVRGLSLTNMDNRYAFGLWIFLDLTVIALGAGAFVTGVLVYLLHRSVFEGLIRSAVVVGFICYSGAILILLVDVGQPLRAWFTFWHPNAHSMLAEVTFCLTCYLLVLAVEYTPLLLRSRRARQSPTAVTFGFELHRVMVVFAALGAFLSFFHQGSLGGLYGVLQGRPFAFREGLLIWPSTFLLFILSAVAVGPSFLLVVTRLVSAITRRRLVAPAVFDALARLSGRLLVAYVLLKCVDTLVWLNRTAPEAGFQGYWFYRSPQFGTWILLAEILVLGLLPGLLLIRRTGPGVQLTAAVLACLGIALNRFAMTIQTLALPTLPFERSWLYMPSAHEVAAFAAVLAYGVLVYSMSYRYLPLFPQERDLAWKE